MALPAPTGRLHAQGLVFRASQGERMILAGVWLNLEPGESLAITGPSGAGKSTLVRLLTGLWKPHAGVVRLDDVDLAQWPREALGPWLGYVPQDVELFAGTVAENIARLGEVDAEKVVQAAQRAGVHALILSLPEGYDTVIELLVLEAGRVKQYGPAAEVVQSIRRVGQNAGSAQVVAMPPRPLEKVV